MTPKDPTAVNDALTINAGAAQPSPSGNDPQSPVPAGSIATVFLDRELRLQRFTSLAQALFELNSTDLGQPLSAKNRVLDFSAILAQAKLSLANLQPTHLEVTAGECWYLVHIVPYPAVDNHVDGVVITFLDIAQQKRTEYRLIESEARYRAIGESIDYGVWLCDAAGRNTYASESFLRMVGVTQQQCSDFGWGEVLHPDDVEATLAAWKDCVRTQGRWDRVHRVKGVDGLWHHVLARGIPIRDANGLVLGWAGINLDVSGLVKADQEIARLGAESERQRRLYETVLTNTPDFVYVFSLDHRVLYANDALIKMWGRGREGAIGKTFLEIGYEPWHAEMHDREIDQVRATRQPIRGEVPFNGTNGRRQYDYIFVPIIGADGEVEAVAGTTRDVTERKEMETQLRIGQEQLDFALSAAELGHWSLNLKDHTAQRTRRHDQLFGYDDLLPEWTYEMFLQHVVPADREEVDASFQHSVQTGSTWAVECRIRRANGVVRDIWTKGLVRRDSEGKVERMLGIVGDITERRQAEARQQFLASLGDTLRPLSDPAAVQAEASRALGEYLGANRVVYYEVRGEEYVVERDYTDHVQSVVGRFPIADFGPEQLECYRAGRTVIEPDVDIMMTRSHRVKLAYAALQIRSVVSVPLVKNGVFVGGLAVQSASARTWTANDVATIEETAERTWAAVERARAESAMRQSEERLRLALNAARMVAWEYDPSSRSVVTSDNATEVYGFAPGGGMENLDAGLAMLHRDDVDRHRATVTAAAATGQAFTSHFRVVRPDNGAVQWMEERGHGICDASGKTTRLVGVTMDITARKQAEAASRESEDRLTFVRRSSGVGFWYCDLPFDVLQWDELVKEHFGLPPDFEVTIDTFYQRLHPDDRDRTREAIEKSITQRSGYNIEYRTIGLDGRERWVNAIGRTGYNAEGKAVRFDGITLDITDKKVVERQLAEASKRTESALMAGEVGTYSWDLKANLLYGDSNFARIFGVAVDERGAAPLEAFLAVIHPDDLDNVRTRIQATLSHNAPYEVEYRIMSGAKERWVVARGTVERDVDGSPVNWIGAIVEITARKQAERQLKESESRRRLAFDAADLGSWNIDPHTNTLVTDERFREIVHGSAAPITYEQAFAAIHPEDRERIRRSIAAATRIVNPAPYAEEYRVVHKDGAVRWVYAKGRAAFEGEGPTKRLVSLDGTVEDISAQVRARMELAASEERYRQLAATLEQQVEQRTTELEASNRQLRLSERMAALGTLSAGLGHDMGNLLVPVRVRLDSLARADLSDASRQDVQAIQSSAEYLRKLASGLRMLALDPQTSGSGEVTEVQSWWEEAEPLLRNALPRGIALKSSIHSGLIYASIGRPAFTQVVFNLVQNAGDAMRIQGTGTVTVQIEVQINAVLIHVIDDGPGMTQEVKTRCMEPFFTTKARDISTGLGLALVYGLVQTARGTIAIDTAIGRGTTFTITLQRAETIEGRREAKPQRTRTACISLREPRLQAIVAAELRLLDYIVDKDVSIAADLFVIDDLSKIGENAIGRPVILVGKSDRIKQDNVIAIGERPLLQTVRQSLRAVVEKESVQ